MSMRRGSEKGTEITLPITPMLDMSFQLLFFFISTFKLPTGQEGTLDLSLPSQATAMANDPAKVNPTTPSQDDKPDLKTVITLEVQKPIGSAPLPEDVGDVILACKYANNGKETLSPPWSKDPDDMKELTAKLQSYVDEATKTQDTITGVKIQGVSRLKVAAVVRVMDACRKAGLKDISFAMPSDFQDYSHLHLGRED